MFVEFTHPYLGRKYRDEENKEGNETPPPKTFTQEQLNEFLAKEKRKHQEGMKKLEAELKAFKEAGVDVGSLQAKVDELNNALLTKEELAKKQAEELQSKFQTELQTEKSQREHWEKQYQNMLFQTEVSRAAAEHDAWDSEQLATLLAPKVKVAPDLDEKGKPKGGFKILAQVTTDDGKTIDLPLTEAVGRMRQDKRYANQFKVKGSPGTGLTLNTQPAGQSGDGMPDPKDSAAYQKWFAEQRKNGNFRF